MIGVSIFSNNYDWEELTDNHNILYSNENLVVTLSGTYSYPCHLRGINDDTILVLEGKIYDRSEEQLFKDIEAVIDQDSKIEHYLFETDGEFYLYQIDLKDQSLKVYGDHLNRLPLYFGDLDGKWVVSRDIGFAQRFLDAPMDQLHLAEFLVFDYNLADHTLFEGISCLQSPDKLVVDIADGCTSPKKKEYFYDFTEKLDPLAKDPSINKLVHLFLEACERRASSKNILSLSGGMDSRSVAAGFYEKGIGLKGVTFEDEEKSATNDVIIAEEIASTLNMDWKKISLSTETFIEDANDLLQFKLGIQPARYYFLNQFCRKVRSLFGKEITFFTGDGGDKVFPDLSNGISGNNDQQLFRLILKENHEFSIPIAAKLTGVSSDRLKESIFDTISSFPGNCSGEKHEYFLLACRMKRYIFEGEDRNRRFFWATSPFFSKPFFEVMMKIDNKRKREEGFYRDFIAQLNGEVASIRDENYSSGKISVSKGFYNFVKSKANSLLSRKHKEQLKSIFEGRKASKTIQLYKQLILDFEEEQGLPIAFHLVKKNIHQFSQGQLSLIATTLMVNDMISNNQELTKNK